MYVVIFTRFAAAQPRLYARSTYHVRFACAVFPHRSSSSHSIIFIKVPTRRVLPRIDLLIVEELDEVVESRSHRSAKERTDPVDPMIMTELRRRHSRAEAACRIERATGVEDAYSQSVSSDTYKVGEDVPPIIATNSASPMPIGAMNVSLLFSAASISTTKTSSAVMNISMKTPCATLVIGDRDVFVALISPGTMAFAIAAAHMAARSCAGKRQRPRMGGSAPARTRPNVTCCMSISMLLFRWVS